MSYRQNCRLEVFGASSTHQHSSFSGFPGRVIELPAGQCGVRTCRWNVCPRTHFQIGCVRALARCTRGCVGGTVVLPHTAAVRARAVADVQDVVDEPAAASVHRLRPSARVHARVPQRFGIVDSSEVQKMSISPDVCKLLTTKHQRDFRVSVRTCLAS